MSCNGEDLGCKAEELGKKYEVECTGCAQSTVAAIFDALGEGSDEVFLATRNRIRNPFHSIGFSRHSRLNPS